MVHNRIAKLFPTGRPKDFHYERDRDVGDVVIFHDRLVDLQETLMLLSNSVQHTEPDLAPEAQQVIADEYLNLADFTGHLASAARKSNVEVTETVAVMRKAPPVNKRLRRCLKNGTDKLLLEEIEAISQDKDKANFGGQVEAFCNAIRDSYKGRDIR